MIEFCTVSLSLLYSTTDRNHRATRPLDAQMNRHELLTSSLYFMIVLFSFEVSTQVTKSSMCLIRRVSVLLASTATDAHRVTRNAGSVTVSGPTRTWPCSINFTAVLTVWAIFDMHMNTARRRRQKAATVSLFSISLSFAAEVRTPMS